MTEKILVKDLQKQDPGSAVVDLYEFEYAKNTWAYFAVGLEADLSTIQMRDYSNNSQINTYVAAPVQAKGFEHQASGTYPNPSFTIANATSVFSGAVGTTDYDSLVGNRVIRRTTLKKYLYGETAATNPPTVPNNPATFRAGCAIALIDFVSITINFLISYLNSY